MREIIFRGKDIDGIWRYGSLLVDEVPTVGKQYIIVENRIQYIVDVETVGQFIGLHDNTRWEHLTPDEHDYYITRYGSKLKYKGRHIYEGDILKHDRHNINEWKAIVEYKDSSFSVKPNGGRYTLNEHRVSVMEIIGNIHDNPELITK